MQDIFDISSIKRCEELFTVVEDFLFQWKMVLLSVFLLTHLILVVSCSKIWISGFMYFFRAVFMSHAKI